RAGSRRRRALPWRWGWCGPWRLLSNRPRHGSSARASGTATPRAGRTRSRRTSGWSRSIRSTPPPGTTSGSCSTGSVATTRGRPRTARRSRTTRAAVRPPTTSEASTRTAASPRRRSPTTAGRLRSRPTTPTPTLTSPARWCGSSAARRRSDTGNATSSSTRVAPGRGSRAPTSSSSSRPTRARGLAGRWNEERRDGTQPGRTCRRPPTECRGLAGAAPMRMLIVGGGGREHALAWKIAQSPRVTALFTAPGNPGIARHAVCVPLAADALDGLVAFARRERIDLTVVGPEAPLVAGLADRLLDAGLAVFGPIAQAAAIEGSKAFAKDLMARNAIPTARFATFDDPARARGYCREVGPPLVVKADGLAGGKGAIVCRTLADADEAVAECMERAAFGAAGATVIVEEFLSGEEVSFFALAHGGPWPEVGPWSTRASVCVVLASGGYPGKYGTGAAIEGVESAETAPGVTVFHAGTALREGRLVTAGGRVLGVTAVAGDLATA